MLLKHAEPCLSKKVLAVSRRKRLCVFFFLLRLLFTVFRNKVQKEKSKKKCQEGESFQKKPCGWTLLALKSCGLFSEKGHSRACCMRAHPLTGKRKKKERRKKVLLRHMCPGVIYERAPGRSPQRGPRHAVWPWCSAQSLPSGYRPQHLRSPHTQRRSSTMSSLQTEKSSVKSWRLG